MKKKTGRASGTHDAQGTLADLMDGKKSFCVVALILGSVISHGGNLAGQDAALRTEVLPALRDATSFYRERVASHGGEVMKALALRGSMSTKGLVSIRQVAPGTKKNRHDH